MSQLPQKCAFLIFYLCALFIIGSLAVALTPATVSADGSSSDPNPGTDPPPEGETTSSGPTDYIPLLEIILPIIA